MSLTQNEKISQVTDTTIVIGVDIASETHCARAFDWRGLELDKVISFENSLEGFTYLLRWIADTAAKTGKDSAVIGLEPTGRYWFTLAAYLYGSNVKLALVNPSHVKKSKELDDGNPGKNDRKDPKTIAKLVLEGRYVLPYIPEGLYAELRVAMNRRWKISKELNSVQNQIQRWLKIYFPEHGKIFGGFAGIASMALLRHAPLPVDLVGLGAEGINQIWRGMKLRAVGIKRANNAFEAAKVSVGCTEGISSARIELRMLLEDYDVKLRQYEEIMALAETLCGRIPGVCELLNIKGIGIVTVAGLFAEIGEVVRFDSPRQLQKQTSGLIQSQTAEQPLFIGVVRI